MISYKCLPDDLQDFGLAGEHPIEIHASIDTKSGCPDSRPSVHVWSVIALFDIYGPIRVDITNKVITSRTELLRLEELVMKDYLASCGIEEESA